MVYKVDISFRVFDTVEVDADSVSEAKMMVKEMMEEKFPEIEDAISSVLYEEVSSPECDNLEIGEPEEE
jgi:hypothetical protein